MPLGNKELAERHGWLDSDKNSGSDPLGVHRRGFLKTTGFITAAAILGGSSASAEEGSDDDDVYYRKTRPTAYTESERENARTNIETYDWAAEIRDEAVENADAILEHWDLEDLWRLVPSQLVPRGNALDGDNAKFVSTAESEGWRIEKLDPEFSLYATSPDFGWEMTHEESGITIPSNDFEAYRESGRDDAGNFDPELADDDLLVNTKNPDLPDDWGVDDGSGFVDDEGAIGPEGTDWYPVSWLCHWPVVYGLGTFLDELSMAYMFTGETEYARAAGVVLDRVGDVYSDLNHRELYDYYDHFFSNSHGGTLQGKFVGSIWEASQIRSWLNAYDGIFPGMDDELVDFLEEKQAEYPEMASKDSLGAVRENIETGFIHDMLPAFKQAQIRGNFGFHQATLAVAAVVADDPDGMTGEAIDYVLQPGTLLGTDADDNPTPGRWYTTGGDVNGFLVGSPQSNYMVDEDGYPTESAPHYNTSQQNSLETLASVLAGYDGYEGADLFTNPKFMSAIDSHWQLTFGKYIPQIGNTHGAGNPKAVAGATPLNGRTIQSADFALLGYDQLRTTELAQWTYMLNGLSSEGLERGIFHPDPVGIGDEIQDVVDEYGAFPNTGANQQPGYGFTALRSGDPSQPTGVYQYYGRNSFGTGSSHTHRDTHNIGIYGFDLDLTPELARRGNDWEGNNLNSWVDSTPAHNTVTVDNENVNPQWVGVPRHFDHNGRVQVMNVESEYAYPQTDEYGRTTALVTVDDDRAYIADFFRVAGGNDHHFSFHATTSRDIAVDGVDLAAQDGGTYAGENVSFGSDGPWSYLYDVERDEDPDSRFSVEWDVEDYWEVREDDAEDVRLRLTMLNDVDEVALATGRPAEQDTENNPEELPFLIAHRGIETPETPDPEVEYGSSVEFDEAARVRTGQTGDAGISVEAQNDLDGFRVTIDAEAEDISEALIRADDGSILAEFDIGGTDPGESVDLPYDDIEAGNEYYLTFGNFGETYVQPSGQPEFPVESDDFDVLAGVFLGDRTTDAWQYNVSGVEAITSYEEPEEPDVEDLETTFTSIIEPYDGDPVVESTELLAVESENGGDPADVRAVSVELTDGRTDYVVSASDPDATFVIDGWLEFEGTFGVYSVNEYGLEEAVYGNEATFVGALEGGRIAAGHEQPRFEGTVTDFTTELTRENQLHLDVTAGPESVTLEELVGRYIVVDPADPDPIPDGVREDDRYDNEARDRRNGVFPIEGVEDHGDGHVTVEVGAHTPIRRYRTNDPADGFSFSIEEGAGFVVPVGDLVDDLEEAPVEVKGGIDTRSNRRVPVEVTATEAVDPTTLDPETVRFGPVSTVVDGGGASPVDRSGAGAVQSTAAGAKLYFDIADAEFDPDDEAAMLVGDAEESYLFGVDENVDIS